MQELLDNVSRLAQLSHTFSDADLSQPWAWRAHNEGVRFALLGSYHELKELAIELARKREAADQPLRAVHRVLAQYHAAYRDLQALLVGIGDDLYDRVPAPDEWPLRDIIGHMAGAERRFFTLVHYGLARQRQDKELPARAPDDEADRVIGPYADYLAILEEQGIAEMLAFYDQLHQRAWREFATMTDEELQGPSIWWEDVAYSLQYRLHRFDAHLRQHTIQVEKTLAAIGAAPNEAKRLLRLIYQALAEVENTTLGAAELGADQRHTVAQAILSRAEEVAAVVAQSRQLLAAVQGGDLDGVNTLLAANPALANCVDQGQLSLVLTATYHGQQTIAAALVEAGARLGIFEAAAIGRLDIVKQEGERWPEYIDEVNFDGFNSLQLACFFGQQEIALWLIEQGADVNAAAQNRQKIRPIHAAAANGNLTVLKALLARGVDVNIPQENDFTPLHTAADHGNIVMTQLFLDHGADRQAVTRDGRTAMDIAQEKGHLEVAALLR